MMHGSPGIDPKYLHQMLYESTVADWNALVVQWSAPALQCALAVADVPPILQRFAQRLLAPIASNLILYSL